MEVSIVAYEVGSKLSFADHKVQLNGATNKPLRGSVLDPLFGSLDKLVNTPKSHVLGSEIDLTALPLRRLRVIIAATWLQAQIDGNFQNYSPYGRPANFDGENFPYTPNWDAKADVQCTWPLKCHLNAVIGAHAQYEGRTRTAFGTDPIFQIPD